MTTQNFTTEFAARFKKSYYYKMGGTQSVIFPNGQKFDFDDRQYYSGRGAKYNAQIRHENIGEVLVSKKQIAEEKKIESYSKKRIAQFKKEAAAKALRISEAKKAGVYSLSPAHGEGYNVELSEPESKNNTFDIDRLASTFKISAKDAALLMSTGKTYVFAKSEDGNTYEFFHPSLYCNNLSIWVGVATPERVAEFSHEEWSSAPYAGMVGQTSAQNHFVC